VAGNWIKWCKGLTEKPEVFRMAKALGLSRNEVAARLMKLWEWADDNAPPQSKRKEKDAFIPGIDCTAIDDICCTKSVSRSLVDCGWIEVRSDGIVFKNFYRHNSQVAKARALDARKKRRQRAEDCPDTNGTNAGPDKIREDIEKKKSTSSSLSARINLDRDRREWVGILEADWQAWSAAYPAVDVRGEAKRALEWCLSNPAKGRKSNYRKFLTGWFQRSQDRGGSAPAGGLFGGAPAMGPSRVAAPPGKYDNVGMEA